MRKVLCFSLVFCICFSFFGCGEKKIKAINKSLQYLMDKYDESFEQIEFSSGNDLSGSPSKLYASSEKLPEGEKILVKGFKKDKVVTYQDNYIALLNMQNVEDKVTAIFKEYYDDFTMDINVFKAVDYSGDDKNITIDEYLADAQNSVRVMIYVKSDDVFDLQKGKIKRFLNQLKANSIYIDSFYIAVFDKDFSLEKIKDDYRYEYAIDRISRNTECKDSITNEYFAYWISKDNDYNYMAK